MERSGPADAVAALDVGGTNVKSGLVSADGVVTRFARRPIDATASRAELVADFAAVLAPLLDDDRTRAAIAFPSPFDYPAGRPLLTHKYAALYGADLADVLRVATGRPDLDIRFVNDAEAAAAGEVVAGAGRGADRVLMITLGTGLGSALVVDGVPVERVGGLVIGDLWTLPVPRLGPRTADDEFCAGGLARRLGVDPATLAVAAEDDAHGGTVFAYGTDLGRFLRDVVIRVRADLVVVGGGAVPNTGDFSDGLATGLGGPWSRAALGAEGPLIGAATLTAQRPRHGSNLPRTV